MTDVYLSGKIIGTYPRPSIFLEKIKRARRLGRLPQDLNLSFSKVENKIEVNIDKGRARRPLIVCENGKPLFSKEFLSKLAEGKIGWEGLVSKGVIEYLDASEEENAFIALKPCDVTKEHTHLELSPLVIVGAQTAMVPYPEHNMSTRVLIGAKTLKQGLGIYACNFLMRTDTDVSILHYPQRPLVRTIIYDYIDYDLHPTGQNIIIAVMSYKGYNMEDAVVMNSSSIEKGLYRSTYFRPYNTEEIRYAGGQVDSIEMPEKDIKGYREEESYLFLEEDGIISPECVVTSGDVLIGKTSPPRFLVSMGEFKIGVEERRETSVAIRHGEGGIVDAVILTESAEGNKFIKVRVRDQRIPELGDKFASRHGQKGVIGLLVPKEDMPFTASGIVPDIIFSPHSIPSRMTVGQLLEIIGAKAGALDGRYVDGTAFINEKEDNLKKVLKCHGFRNNGCETMYDGITGEQYEARIFVGGSYYMKLRHMVANKIHARSRGPVQLLTRQPTEGRSKEGGLRLGEMEKDCFVAHGAALLLQERFSSDKDVLPVCKKCGMIAIYNKFRDKTFCSMCGEDAPVTFIEISYAFKLLLDELKSLCIYPKIKIKPKE